jgi:hypothetical protein
MQTRGKGKPSSDKMRQVSEELVVTAHGKERYYWVESDGKTWRVMRRNKRARQAFEVIAKSHEIILEAEDGDLKIIDISERKASLGALAAKLLAKCQDNN